MVSFLSLSGHISAHFDNIQLKLSTRAYFETSFHRYCQSLKILKSDFMTSSLMNSIDITDVVC